jgi:hypothetical protein
MLNGPTFRLFALLITFAFQTACSNKSCSCTAKTGEPATLDTLNDRAKSDRTSSGDAASFKAPLWIAPPTRPSRDDYRDSCDDTPDVRTQLKNERIDREHTLEKSLPNRDPRRMNNNHMMKLSVPLPTF